VSQDPSPVFVSFDIGNAPGRVGVAGYWVAFNGTEPLLRASRGTRGLRVGVGTEPPAEMRRARDQALPGGAGARVS
jgi:hypothetical protein